MRNQLKTTSHVPPSILTLSFPHLYEIIDPKFEIEFQDVINLKAIINYLPSYRY